ncbi:hypothetical protein PMAYCL1PPCAC_09411, partial [Pristionchus mayeri]
RKYGDDMIIIKASYENIHFFCRDNSQFFYFTLCDKYIHILDVKKADFLPTLLLEGVNQISQIVRVENGRITVKGLIQNKWHLVTTRLPEGFFHIGEFDNYKTLLKFAIKENCREILLQWKARNEFISRLNKGGNKLQITKKTSLRILTSIYQTDDGTIYYWRDIPQRLDPPRLFALSQRSYVDATLPDNVEMHYIPGTHDNTLYLSSTDEV